MAPLSKEKAQPAFEMACRESARALRCKAPRVTHAVAVLLLGLHFHTEDPDCVNNTVNISMFPDPHMILVDRKRIMCVAHT